jgi:hypothetical protein
MGEGFSMPTELKSANGKIGSAIDALTANVVELRKNATPEQKREITAYATAIVLGTVVDPEKVGDNLGIPSLGKLGQIAFQLAITTKYGKVSKAGDKVAKVPLQDVTLDMVIGIDSDTLEICIDDVRTKQLKDAVTANNKLKTVCKLNDDGSYKSAAYTEQELKDLLIKVEAAIEVEYERAVTWLTDVFPSLPGAILLLNELKAGTIVIGNLPQLPVSLVVPIMVAGYTLSASVIGKIHMASTKKSAVLDAIKGKRAADAKSASESIAMFRFAVAPVQEPTKELVEA